MPSPMHLVYADLSYCSLCDRYFPTKEARAIHVEFAANHPQCETCDKRFANGNSLRNHYVSSSRHHYCAVCERDFSSAAGLRVHIEFSAIHRDDSDDGEEEDDDLFLDEEPGWEDMAGRELYPEDNEAALATDDESELSDYWVEDDEMDMDFEQEQAFNNFSFAPVQPRTVLPSAAIAEFSRPRAPSGDSNASSEASLVSIGSNQAVGSVSDLDDEAYEPTERMDMLGPSPNNAPSSAAIHAIAAAISRGEAEEADARAEREAEADNEEDYHRSQFGGIAPSHPRSRNDGYHFTCGVCLEAPTAETSATKCGHVFCSSCIAEALSTRKRCPVCRKAAGPMQLRRLYLSAN
ncbi:hypothetical protein EIP91_009592 [Steccherinum ochraceum]|uniref:RING-type domain-containing protein n=1 Tax=Steccherinum ochraceum TaxID=92696 RepID=A0A4V6N788_9APHY|nr:hypothetical protein EIP91_009592 [Steccherinum ochraceum]